jgi:hypothetical protein
MSSKSEDVPILTQSEDWALCYGYYYQGSKVFQSSPSPKTGRYPNRGEVSKGLLVPILTQSEDWALF